MPYKDPEVRRLKNREQVARWRAAHPDKARKLALEASRRWRATHNWSTTNYPGRRFCRVLRWAKYWDGCAVCGCREPRLHLHHPAAVEKTATSGSPGRPTEAKWREFLQCVTVCNPCHAQLSGLPQMRRKYA